MVLTARSALPRSTPYYEPVDLAFVVESTYPYLRGGLSAVVHDIVRAHPDMSIGIIHITWDRNSPHEDLYVVPPNVRWVFPVYLSMTEHVDDFSALSPSELRMGAAGRKALARQLFRALRAAIDQGNYTELWRIYDDGINPHTRQYILWPLIKTKEFLSELRHQMSDLEISLTDVFWLIRDFFSIACAVMDPVYPRAQIYHSHTTGYAAVAGAVAARQHGKHFMLTEHNLYVRDTINTMLDVSMNTVVRAEDWRKARHLPVKQHMWMAWWIEIGRLNYHDAELVTYLYPDAIDEARGLGASLEKAFVITNGIHIETFEQSHRRFLELSAQRDEQRQPWRLAFAARIVPIKGLHQLLPALALLRSSSGVEFTLDVMGPADEAPSYAEECRRQCSQLGLDDIVAFVGNQNLCETLPNYDLLVLPSYNEGLPVVVLEAMAVGLPIVGSRVGGMAQVIESQLTGHDNDSCGVLVAPGDVRALAEALHVVLSSPGRYQQLQSNTRNRVLTSFLQEQVMSRYRDTYMQMYRNTDRQMAQLVSGR